MTNHTLIDDVSGVIHNQLKSLAATRTQRKRIERLLVRFTKSYFTGSTTINEAYQVASDEVARYHLPFILGAAPDEPRRLALYVFREIGVDLTALPASDDNAAIVAIAVSAWTRYVSGGMRSRDAAWRVVGELSDVIGGAGGK